MFFNYLPDKDVIGGHRGARSVAPENTLLAMVRAWEYGAHFWEADVRLSKDNELILCHDATLVRTTDIARHSDFQQEKDYSVDQYTLQKLRKLDAGSWFLDTDPFATIEDGEVDSSAYQDIWEQKIPTLHEALVLSKSLSFPLNLEIKSLRTAPGDVGVVDRILGVIQETSTTALVLLSSFRHEYLQRARVLNKHIALAAIVEQQHPRNLVQYLKNLEVCAYHPDAAICERTVILQLQEEGVRVNAWTVNDEKQVAKLHSLGVGVITDWPQRFT